MAYSRSAGQMLRQNGGGIRVHPLFFNHLTTGAAYILVFIFY